MLISHNPIMIRKADSIFNVHQQWALLVRCCYTNGYATFVIVAD